MLVEEASPASREAASAQGPGGGVSLKNDSIDHHQFLSSDHAEACAKTEFNLILTTAL